MGRCLHDIKKQSGLQHGMSSQMEHGACACAGVSPAIALLLPEPTLASSVLHDLADEAIIDVVKPDLALLTVLLDKELFDKVAGGLQAQLIKLLSSDAAPPFILLLPSETIPSLCLHHAHPRSILLPALVSLLTAQGYYAQAAALCMYHTHIHPAFHNVEIGLQQLLPYLVNAKKSVKACNIAVADFSTSWPLPHSLFRVSSSLSALLDAAMERMKVDNYDSIA